MTADSERRTTVAGDEERAVLAVMDALLPGGRGFPKASDTAMGAMLIERLRRASKELLERVAAALGAGSFADADSRDAAVARLEAAEPRLFRDVRKLAYLTYYEQPAVIEAIHALGIRYNDAPLPEGYPPEPFEPGRDGPRHQRGRWVRTDEVRRVDMSRLNLEGNAP